MSAPPGPSVVVVGGGLAGARTCEQLRKQGHQGRIVLMSAEPVPPYDRPPLSKAVLRGRRESKPLKIDFAGLDVDVRLDTPADSLDVAGGRVGAGTCSVPFDRLVIATGSAPVRLPGPGEQHVLRTDRDALRLRERLVPGARVVVIGASWIGAEVVTAALANGCRVSCLEADPAPLARAIGVDLGRRTLPWWSEVDLRLECPVGSVEHGGVALADGSFLPADLVVTGVGVRPSTEWLAGCGLALGPSVPTDHALRTELPGVVAVGDVAAWWSRRFDTRMHLEHWDDASAGAAVAASSVIHGANARLVHDPVPYFWSDQFGHKVEYVGHHVAADRMLVREPTDDEPGWSACWTDAHDRLVAVLTADRSAEVAAGRKLIAGGRAGTVDELRGTPLRAILDAG